MYAKLCILSGMIGLGAIAAGEAASVNSGAAFLGLDAGARPAAMAGAYTSAAGSLDSMGYNPGGLAALDRKELLVTHAEWLVGTQYDVIGYGQRVGHGVVALGATRLNLGTLDGRNSQGAPTGDFKAHDDVYSLSYSGNVGGAVGAGVTAKYVGSTIGQDSASTYAFDVGAVSRLQAARLWVGAAALNIGPGIKFLDQTDSLPLTLALGAAAQPQSRWTIACDLKNQPHDHYTTLALGSEFRPLQMVSLRAGYSYPLQAYPDQDKYSLSNVKTGAGFWFANWRLDYAIAPFDNLGLTHRITVVVNFGGEKESELLKNLRHVQKTAPSEYPYPIYDATDDDLQKLIENYPDAPGARKSEQLVINPTENHQPAHVSAPRPYDPWGDTPPPENGHDTNQSENTRPSDPHSPELRLRP